MNLRAYSSTLDYDTLQVLLSAYALHCLLEGLITEQHSSSRALSLSLSLESYECMYNFCRTSPKGT